MATTAPASSRSSPSSVTKNPHAPSLPHSSLPLHSHQLDASPLEEELHSLLVPRATSLFDYFAIRSSLPKDDIVNAVLRLISFFVTTFRGIPSPSMEALGLGMGRRETSSSDYGDDIDARRDKLGLLIFAFCSVILPALHGLALRRIGEGDDGLAEENDQNLERVARYRRRLLLSRILRTFEKTVPVLRLANYLTFLTGRNRSSSLSMYLSGLAYETSNRVAGGDGGIGTRKRINYSYAQRRVLYAEIVTCASMFLPIAAESSFSMSGLRSWLDQINPFGHWRRRPALHVRRDDASNIGSSNTSTIANPCPICYSDPISIPYITSCDHVFCYVCLRCAVIDDPFYKCRVCGELISSSSPLLADRRDSPR